MRHACGYSKAVLVAPPRLRRRNHCGGGFLPGNCRTINPSTGHAPGDAAAHTPTLGKLIAARWVAAPDGADCMNPRPGVFFRCDADGNFRDAMISDSPRPPPHSTAP